MPRLQYTARKSTPTDWLIANIQTLKEAEMEREVDLRRRLLELKTFPLALFFVILLQGVSM